MKLSDLASMDRFALLGPGYSEGAWTLVTSLAPSSQPNVVLAEFETSGRPQGWRGETRRIESLEWDVAPEPCFPAFDEARYAAGVAEIRDAIAAGDVYQVNLTTRVELGPCDGAALFARLHRRAVAPFSAWLRVGSLEIVSASPELLFSVSGTAVCAQPMKGTAPAGETHRLHQSVKDEAELAMITDLLRNDLTRVCEPRSVRVENERRFIELPYAVQAVSDVRGRLRADVTPLDVLAALHPGGSVTGAPKQAAIETIRRLESEPRGAYCGALMYLDGARATAALLIRTAQRESGRFWYGVGAGITWDSDPASEVAELHTKLGALS